MAIIAVTGFIGSGKDTVADYLVANHNYKRVSFAGTLKDATAAVFGWDRDLLEGKTVEGRNWREQVDQWWADRLGIPHLTPRWVLQQWGTEVFRHRFHDEIWIASLENKIRNTSANVVISDCRFINEIKAIKRTGGKIVRVTRGPNPEWYDVAVKQNKEMWARGENTGWENLMKLGYPDVHASEYSWVGYEFDRVIDNNGTLDELYAQIKDLG